MIALAVEPVAVAPRDEVAYFLVQALGLPAADPEVQDIAGMLLAAYTTAWGTGQPGVLTDALGFARGRFELRGLLDVGLAELGVALTAAVGPRLTASGRTRLREFVSRCATEPVAVPPGGATHLDPRSAAYLAHLLDGDRRAAVALTRQWATEGLDVPEILVDVLGPAQREVGRLWAAGAVSIAQERFCTAVKEFVMSDLYPGMFREVSARRLMAVHAPGSLHHLGLRMVADVLECRGWSTTYVGEEVAAADLPDLLAADLTDLLIVSASMPGQVLDVGAMIREVRADPHTQSVKVVVGGRPFSVAPDLVQSVGADGWASDARSAIDVCDGLVGGAGDG